MTDTSDDLQAKVLQTLQENWPATVTPTDDMDALFIDIGLDSLDISSLILAVEEKFGIQVSDDQILEISCMKDVVSVVRSATA